MIIIVTLIVIICTIFGIYFRLTNYYDINNKNKQYAGYIYTIELDKENTAKEILKIIVAFIFNFNTLIPLSIMISLIVLKSVQASYIERDPNLKDSYPDGKMKVLSTNIQEDLGCLKYVFTDKTGTLTKNEMEISSLSIYSRLFEEELTCTNAQSISKAYSSNFDLGHLKIVLNSSLENYYDFDISSNNNRTNQINTNNDSELQSNFNSMNLSVNGNKTEDKNYLPSKNLCIDDFDYGLVEFFINIAVNNNVIVDETIMDNQIFGENNDNDLNIVESNINKDTETVVFKQFNIKEVDYIANQINTKNTLKEKKNIEDNPFKNYLNCSFKYQGSNPDEVTLVSAAHDAGIAFVDRDSHSIKIRIRNKILVYKILYKFDFSSARLRSSIILKDPEGKIKLYIKGADTVIVDLKKLDNCYTCNNKDNLIYKKFSNIYYSSKEQLNFFAKKGLRTLCFASKEINENEFLSWESKYKDIKTKAIEDKSKYNCVENVISEIESNLYLTGISGITDKLQELVPETLNSLLEANINVWMLTGDKLDTAESIGFSCKLFKDDTEVFKIRTVGAEETYKLLNKTFLDMINLENEVHDNYNNITNNYFNTNISKSIIQNNSIKQNNITKFNNNWTSKNCLSINDNSNNYCNEYSKVNNLYKYFNEYNEINCLNKSFNELENINLRYINQVKLDNSYKNITGLNKINYNQNILNTKEFGISKINEMFYYDLIANNYFLSKNKKFKNKVNYKSEKSNIYKTLDNNSIVCPNISDCYHNSSNKYIINTINSKDNIKIDKAIFTSNANLNTSRIYDSYNNDKTVRNSLKFIEGLKFKENENSLLCDIEIKNYKIIDFKEPVADETIKISGLNKDKINVDNYLYNKKVLDSNKTKFFQNISPLKKSQNDLQRKYSLVNIKNNITKKDINYELLNDHSIIKYMQDKEFFASNINNSILEKSILHSLIVGDKNSSKLIDQVNNNNCSSSKLKNDIQCNNINNIKRIDKRSKMDININIINNNYNIKNYNYYKNNKDNQEEIKEVDNKSFCVKKKSIDFKKKIKAKKANVKNNLDINYTLNNIDSTALKNPPNQFNKKNLNSTKYNSKSVRLNTNYIENDYTKNKDLIISLNELIRKQEEKIKSLNESNNYFSFLQNIKKVINPISYFKKNTHLNNIYNNTKNEKDYIKTEAIIENNNCKQTLNNDINKFLFNESNNHNINKIPKVSFIKNNLNVNYLRKETQHTSNNKLLTINNTSNIISSDNNKKNVKNNKINFGLIIDGSSISYCLEDKNNDLFWKLLCKSKSIICSRCSPLQKSEIVNFVKERSGKVTLAIGDGGNDVNMIKKANIGVGIFGKEGYQAAYNSDYAINSFKYLKVLIFKHGHYSLLRNTYFCIYFFFKNLIFTLAPFWFCLNNGFSGQQYFDDYYYLSYNSFLTTLPIMIKSAYDEDFDYHFKNHKDASALK